MPLDLEILKTSSLLAYPLVFLGGVITSIGSFNVAMMPLIIGYLCGSAELSRQRSFTLSLTFAAGLPLTFTALTTSSQRSVRRLRRTVPSTNSKGTDEPLIPSSPWEDLKSREGDTADELLAIVRGRNCVPS